MPESPRRTTARSPQRRKSAGRGKNGRKKRSNLGRYKAVAALLVFVLAAYTVFSMVSLQSELSAVRATLSEKKQTLEEKSAENKQLRELLENGSQKELIERAAREKLGYVYAGEEIFENISGN